MKIVGLGIFLLFFFLKNADAQIVNDTIVIKKDEQGFSFMQDGKYLKWKTMQKMMEPYPEAYENMKYARTNRIAAYSLETLGAFCIGWFLGDLIENTNDVRDGGLFIFGSLSFILSIPPLIKSPKQAKKAVLIYNKSIVKM